MSRVLEVLRHIYRDDMSADEKHAKPSGQGRILGGYLLACLTSGIALGATFAVLAEIGSSRSQWRIGMMLGDTIALTIFTAPVVMMLTFLPVIPFVWWTEKRAERRFIVHAVAGIAMAALGSILLPLVMKGFTFQGVTGLAVFFLFAGLVAGATYWLVAGRRAGAGCLSRKS